ncbi:hypothetical protein GLV94_01955 [Virgibacillus halodenitrificans]|uniref:hypothetical protein n=1 Tax=Virgibacillus halodenitrificans TaxID=1482 RepID=UPI0013696FAF|nr:hypothetical protein [Virgibacillus halodenitrificans]MYL44398.1 hypothetical protein [Virgibacillus halodenitrificans]
MAKKRKTNQLTTIDGYRLYVDYSLHPPELNTDINGDYVQSQLKEITRAYNALQNGLNSKYGKRKELTEILTRKENGEYKRLLYKPDKTKEEHEALYLLMVEIEDLYNALHSINRQIRELERRSMAVYPPKLMEIVDKELDKEGDNQ